MEAVRYLPIVCFAILAATEVTGMTPEMKNLVYPTKGFLIGEETPVYVADRPNDGEVVYKKLEKGIVKKAFDRWENADRDGRTPNRHQVNFTKRDSGEVKALDLYPTILVVLDHGNGLPISIPDKEDGIILDRIIYAMAYFNDVDLQLRNSKYVNLPLRIAAIIINRSFKNSWPYMKNIDVNADDGLSKALNPMLKYWRDLGKTSTDFPKGSYDIVVQLTSSDRKITDDMVVKTSSSSTSPPCNQEDEIAGLIVADNLWFDSIRTTVTRLSWIFGDNEYTSAQTSYFKDWPKESSDKIFDALKTQKCMTKPKEYHPPGNPVPTILPGEIYSDKQQCHGHGWNENNHPSFCWRGVWPDREVSNCYWLYCTNAASDFGCRNKWGYSNPTLTGTVCNNDSGWTGICVQGICVKL